MLAREGSNSPSPSPPCCSVESNAVPLSCRGSRAGSEAPHRHRGSFGRSSRSRRQSRSRSNLPQQGNGEVGHVRDSSYESLMQYNRMAELAETIGEKPALRKMRTHHGKGRRRDNPKQCANGMGKCPSKNADSASARRCVGSSECAAGATVSGCRSSRGGRCGVGVFTLFQKLCYPFAPNGGSPKRGMYSDVFDMVDSAELEAIGSPTVTNMEETRGMRSVLRRAPCTIPPRVNCVATSMLTDHISGSPLLAVGVGDVNGRVNYCELPVGPLKPSLSSVSGQRKSVSVVSAASPCPTELNMSSMSTSVASGCVSQQFDALGFQQAPVRKHGHQAYVEELDCLTSVPISKSVKCLQFLKPQQSPNTVSYLTSNERVIKLFRVQREGISLFHAFPQMESVVGPLSYQTRYFPRSSVPPLIVPARVFSGCHVNPIQGLSVCADEQSFLSADDLEVFWWNFECPEGSKGSRIADLRPQSGCMDEVSELVTTAGFHPTHNSLFFVGRNSGFLGIGDLRESANGAQRHYSTHVQVKSVPRCIRSFHDYGEILCSISSAGFVGGNHIVTRDYLSLKLWDLRLTSEPCDVVWPMPYVEPYLDSLYESDSIFDRFTVAVDHISGTIITGLYDGAVAAWQPFNNGRHAAEDVLTFYRPDPLALMCEVENGGRMTAEGLQLSFSRGLATHCGRRIDGSRFYKDVVPDPIANKVICVSISEGGELFALSLREGQSVFVFNR